MVDRALAAEEAAELYSAGELQFGTDESVFLKVMATRNVYQLRATFEEYQKVRLDNWLFIVAIIYPTEQLDTIAQIVNNTRLLG